jgi:hypothetical protein
LFVVILKFSISQKASRKESSKRKHGDISQSTSSQAQSSQVGEGVDTEDYQLLQQLRSDEYSPFNRLTALNAVGSDFAIALKLFNDRVLKPKEAEDAQKAAQAASSSSKHSGAKKSNPIIIVPSALTSTITMYNAKQFLESGTLVPFSAENGGGLPQQKKAKFEFFKREINSQTGASIPYKIIDDPLKLTSEEWESVAVVFVTGQAWQFKGWKYATPQDLFQNVLGIHLMYDDQQPPPTIQSWNCKILKVSVENFKRLSLLNSFFQGE